MTLTHHHLANLLSEVADFDTKQPFSFKYLSDGLTNDNYWLNIADEEYVLRLNHPLSSELGIHRSDETKIMKVASKIHLSPDVHYLSKQNNFRISHWINGDVWTKNQLRKSVNLNRLAQQLRNLHSVNISNLPTLNLINRIESYRTVIKQRSAKPSSIEQRVLKKAIYLIQSMQQQLPHCLCHNDLIAANVIEQTQFESSKLIFLDWEYAAVTSPLFELAVISRANELSMDEQDYLLQSYLNLVPFSNINITLDSQQLDSEFQQWLWIYDYISLLWKLAILPQEISLPSDIDDSLTQLNDTILID